MDKKSQHNSVIS